MRFLVAGICSLIAAGSIGTSLALSLQDGKVVRGRYLAAGRAIAAGVQVIYGPSRVNVKISGRLRGAVLRTIYAGSVVTRDAILISGKVRSLKLRAQKGTFTAPAVIRLGSGAAFRGKFSGLFESNQKPSRFFRGKINGVKNSNLTLRSN